MGTAGDSGGGVRGGVGGALPTPTRCECVQWHGLVVVVGIVVMLLAVVVTRYLCMCDVAGVPCVPSLARLACDAACAVTSAPLLPHTVVDMHSIAAPSSPSSTAALATAAVEAPQPRGAVATPTPTPIPPASRAAATPPSRVCEHVTAPTVLCGGRAAVGADAVMCETAPPPAAPSAPGVPRRPMWPLSPVAPRLCWLQSCCAVAEGADVLLSRTDTLDASSPCPPAVCVGAVLGDALHRVSVLGGRDGMPRSLGSVYGGAVTRFLGVGRVVSRVIDTLAWCPSEAAWR